MTQPLGLLGAGHQALEVADFGRPRQVTFLAVDDLYIDPSEPLMIDIATQDHEHLDTEVIAAVGAPGLRRALVSRWAGDRFATVVANPTWVSDSVNVGSGSVIAPATVLSTRVTVGRHCLINVGVTISHNSVLGDYVTVSPRVAIAGDCTIGDGVFLGIGATVAHRATIASGCVIGAGAVVVGTLSEPGVYVGVPARLVRPSQEWLDEL